MSPRADKTVLAPAFEALLGSKRPLPEATQHHLFRLAMGGHATDALVRLAERPDTAGDVVDALCQAPAAKVRASAYSRGDIEPARIEHGACVERSHQVLRVMARSEAASPLALRELSRRAASIKGLPKALLENPKTSGDALVDAICAFDAERPAVIEAEGRTRPHWQLILRRVQAAPEIHDSLAKRLPVPPPERPPHLAFVLASSPQLSRDAQRHLVDVFARSDAFSRRKGATALGSSPVLEPDVATYALERLAEPYGLTPAGEVALHRAARRSTDEVATMRKYLAIAESTRDPAVLTMLAAQVEGIPLGAEALAGAVAANPAASDATVISVISRLDAGAAVAASMGRSPAVFAQVARAHPGRAGELIAGARGAEAVQAVLSVLDDTSTLQALATSLLATCNPAVVLGMRWDVLSAALPRSAWASDLVAERLTERLGDDTASLDTFGGLSATFNGTFEELLDVISAIV